VPVLTKTLRDAGFDDIFTEVTHTETLGLANPNSLRMFHLAVDSNLFTHDTLHRFLLRNVGRYVYSRAQIDNFTVSGDAETIAANAIAQLRERYGTAGTWLGDELGDVLLYAFLEHLLDAPKLFSKYELPAAAGGCIESSGSVHLLSLDSATPAYQMVFGKSRILGDLQDAVDDAFEAIVEIRSGATTSLNIVDNTAFTRLYSPEAADELKSAILPSKTVTAPAPAMDKAFGVFLGYKLGLDHIRFSNAEFRDAMQAKMETDIANNVAYIKDKIATLRLGTHSFYFYILPFNDADADKQSIMETLLDGRAV
jgi:hypothetical protein